MLVSQSESYLKAAFVDEAEIERVVQDGFGVTGGNRLIVGRRGSYPLSAYFILRKASGSESKQFLCLTIVLQNLWGKDFGSIYRAVRI